MYAIQTILSKARENLHAARLCQREKHYNATANRAYYACAQAAFAILIQHHKTPAKPSHDSVYREFLGVYSQSSSKLPKILSSLRTHRETADYTDININPRQALDCIIAANDFVSQLLQYLKRK